MLVMKKLYNVHHPTSNLYSTFFKIHNIPLNLLTVMNINQSLYFSHSLLFTQQLTHENVCFIWTCYFFQWELRWAIYAASSSSSSSSSTTVSLDFLPFFDLFKNSFPAAAVVCIVPARFIPAFGGFDCDLVFLPSLMFISGTTHLAVEQ